LATLSAAGGVRNLIRSQIVPGGPLAVQSARERAGQDGCSLGVVKAAPKGMACCISLPSLYHCKGEYQAFRSQQPWPAWAVGVVLPRRAPAPSWCENGPPFYLPPALRLPTASISVGSEDATGSLLRPCTIAVPHRANSPFSPSSGDDISQGLRRGPHGSCPPGAPSRRQSLRAANTLIRLVSHGCHSGPTGSASRPAGLANRA